MTDLKSKVQHLDPNVHARDINELVKDTQNVYETLAIIARRARQLNADLKAELHEKLEDFAVNLDTIEEIQENKEQIEISKFYERLANPAIIATEEFLQDEIAFRYKEKEQTFQKPE